MASVLSIVMASEVDVAKTDWQDTDGTIAEIEERQSRSGTYYSVVFTYKVDGHWYSGTYTEYSAVGVGDTIPVRYDPKNPERNDLVVKETRKHWIIGAVIAVIVIVVIVAHMF